jgi:hypothetical protein
MFQIAIPSYKRAETLRAKTLKMVEREGIDVPVIIFVADESEKQIYETVCPGHRIVVGVLGIHKQREFMERFYPVGERVIFLDDDISSIKRIGSAKRWSLMELFRRCFAIAEKSGATLWGISPTDNGLSMKDEAVLGLRFCIGCCYGLRIQEPLNYPNALTEDFTRSLERFLRDGKVIRFNCLGPTTRYAKEPGGLQTIRTPERQEQEMRELSEKYPDFVRLRQKSGKPMDVRLKLVVSERLREPFAPTPE